MPKIVLIRHGQTGWNAENRHQGWSNNPLSEEGLEQAALLGEHVRSQFPGIRVISSDLMRCLQTADAIGMRYETDGLIREINAGRFSGLLRDEVETKYPGLLNSLGTSLDGVRPGGESWMDVLARARRFVEQRRLFEIDQDVLIVSHGGTICCLLVALLNLQPESVFEFQFDNTGISIVEHAGSSDTARLEVYNSTEHLNRLHLA